MTEQNNTTNSLAHTKWNCKYHIVFAPKYRRKVFYAEKREDIREIIRTLCQRARAIKKQTTNTDEDSSPAAIPNSQRGDSKTGSSSQRS